ncbi:MAG: oxidoreductase [Conexibacter sp.]|nr:oxidoreductase [Conexibacter sp.]
MGRLSGKVAVVTGASKGIGAATAKALAADGAKVVVTYLTGREGAGDVVAQIADGGGAAVAIRADVTKEADVVALFDETAQRYGAIDVLVNNAGVFGFAPLASVTEDEYHRQFQVNVLGLLLTTRIAVPYLAARGASIINISSVVSTLAPVSSAVSGGSKAAVDAITKSLAKELGPRGIRVNAVNPGVIMTEGLVAAGLAGGAFEQDAVALTPLGRVGQPDDIALPVAFLASDDARWITGETIIAAGGEGM